MSSVLLLIPAAACGGHIVACHVDVRLCHLLLFKAIPSESHAFFVRRYLHPPGATFEHSTWRSLAAHTVAEWSM